MLYSLTLGLATLAPNGIVLDLLLGVAGLACAAHVPIMSSLLTSVYSVPSMRRHLVFTFFLAGGNAFAVVFGALGSGAVTFFVGEDWRGCFVYISGMYVLVAAVGALAIPSMPRSYPAFAVSSGAEDQHNLLRQAVERRISIVD